MKNRGKKNPIRKAVSQKKAAKRKTLHKKTGKKSKRNKKKGARIKKAVSQKKKKQEIAKRKAAEAAKKQILLKKKKAEKQARIKKQKEERAKKKTEILAKKKERLAKIKSLKAAKKENKKKAKTETPEKKVETYMKTNIPGFDALFDPGYGIPNGASVLIEGGPGSGKTIFGLSAAIGLCRQGKKCLYMSFEEPEDRLIDHMKHFNWEVDEFIKKGNLRIKRFDAIDVSRSVEALLSAAKKELLI